MDLLRDGFHCIIKFERTASDHKPLCDFHPLTKGVGYDSMA